MPPTSPVPEVTWPTEQADTSVANAAARRIHPVDEEVGFRGSMSLETRASKLAYTSDKLGYIATSSVASEELEAVGRSSGAVKVVTWTA